MTPSGELFELIRSMSQAEKTYFKKYSRLHTVGTQNSYLVLFDAINRQTEYDEKKLRSQLSRHGFVRHFAVVKNYLYSRILDSLESYHRDVNINTQVRRAITRAEVLHRKGLYRQSEKLAEKTKHIAEQNDLHHALVEIYSTLDIILYSEKNDSKSLYGLYEKASDSLLAVRENMLTHNLSTQMVNCYFNYSQTRNELYLKEAEQITHSKLFKEAARAQTFMGKLRFNEINFTYRYMKNDLPAAHRYEEKIIALFDSNPGYLKNNTKKYIAALNNLFVISTEQGKISASCGHLLKLKAAAPLAKTHSQKAMHFQHYTINRMHYLCQTGQTEELNNELPDMISEMGLYESELTDLEKIDLLMHYAISYFTTGDLKKCISYLNKLRNEHDLSHNPEAQSFFYLFYLIVHYDAGNREIVASALQTFYRFLKQKKEISLLERTILTLLKKLSKTYSEKEITEEYKGFARTLARMEKNYLDKYIFKYFDLAAWLESKAEKRPFAEIMKRKFASG